LRLAAPVLDTLRLQPNERILIIAPHPDDEVLACGGLIQQALALSDSVWVVYVTAGDGSWPPAWRVTGNLFAGPEDYITLGRARMEEATAGTRALGLDSAQLTFLGYPDAELTRLWQQDWYIPCRSSHTEAITDPYGRNGREYTGNNLLDDLMSLLRALKPDRVFAPHPLDAHPDHWSTAMFLAIARECWRQPADRPFPAVHYYLIHHPSYPDAWTDNAGFISPPGDLTGAGHHWFTIYLSDEQRRAKQAALRCHDSQLGSAGNNLYGYAAGNELFDLVEDATGLVTEDAPQVTFVPATRFSSVQASVDGESLDLRVSLEAEPSPSLHYSFLAHSVELDADTVVHSGFTVEVTSGQSAESQGWSIRMPRNQPSGRGALLYSAEVRWGSVLLNHSGIGRIVY
jgi:LmbE family N-acetylglucosaminyl deacetylase